MNKREFSKLRNTILEGMKVSSQKLIAQKKLLKQKVVISEGGVIKEISAEDLV